MFTAGCMSFAPVQTSYAAYSDVWPAFQLTASGYFSWKIAQSIIPAFCTVTVQGRVACATSVALHAAVIGVIFGYQHTPDATKPISESNPAWSGPRVLHVSNLPARINPDPTAWNNAPATGGNPTPKQEIASTGTPTFQTLTTNAQVFAACDMSGGVKDCTIYATDGTAKVQHHIIGVPSTTVSSMPATDPTDSSMSKNSFTTTLNAPSGYTKMGYFKTWGGVKCPVGYVYDATRNGCQKVASDQSILKPPGTLCEDYINVDGVPIVDSQNPECLAVSNRGPTLTAPGVGSDPGMKLRICTLGPGGTNTCLFAGPVTDPAEDASYASADSADVPSSSNPGLKIQIDNGVSRETTWLGRHNSTTGGRTVVGKGSGPSTGDPLQGSITEGGDPALPPGGGGGSGSGGGSCGGPGQAPCAIDDSGFGTVSGTGTAAADIATSDAGLISKIEALSATNMHDNVWEQTLDHIIPDTTYCSVPDIVFRGKTLNTSTLCDKLAPLRQILGVVLYFYLVFSVFHMATEPRRSAT
jgi:hypothetical protein